MDGVERALDEIERDEIEYRRRKNSINENETTERNSIQMEEPELRWGFRAMLTAAFGSRPNEKKECEPTPVNRGISGFREMLEASRNRTVENEPATVQRGIPMGFRAMLESAFENQSHLETPEPKLVCRGRRMGGFVEMLEELGRGSE